MHFEFLQLGYLFAGHKLLACASRASILWEIRLGVAPILQAEELGVLESVDFLFQLLKLGFLAFYDIVVVGDRRLLILVKLRVDGGSMAQKECVIVLRVLRGCKSSCCVAVLGVPQLIFHEFFC